jgi:predicted permease
MLDDLRHAARALARTPLFLAVAVLSLAIGIGANLVIFSVVNAILLRPLPVREPDALVRLGRVTGRVPFGSFSHPDLRDLQADTFTFAGVVGHFPNPVVLADGPDVRREWMEIASGNYFAVLGTRFSLGRGFAPDEDRVPGRDAVVVISHALWQRRFAGDSAVVGRTVRLNRVPFTVIGVTAPGFQGTFAGFAVDLWMPAMMMPVALRGGGSLDSRTDHSLMVLARLRDGVSIDRARADAVTLAARLRAASPDTANPITAMAIEPASGVHPFLARIVRAFLALLQGVTLLVLLIACVNLANLLIVRFSDRRRDLAMRAALGAGRRRLASRLLAECAVLALAGGGLALAIAWWGASALERFRPPVGIPLELTIAPDFRVVFVAVLLALGTLIAGGVGPALAASRVDTLRDLRVGGATIGRRQSRVRRWLVGAQVALASLLVIAASLLVRSLRNTASIDPGFDPDGVVVLSASPEMLGYDRTRGRALWNGLTTRLEGSRRVLGVAAAAFAYLGDRGDALMVAPTGSDRAGERLPYNIVQPGFFETLRIPMRDGRDFTDIDEEGRPDVAIVSEAMARRLFGTERVLGRTVRLGEGADGARTASIVGVVPDVKLGSLGEAPRPIVYLPFGQWYRGDLLLHVRSTLPAAEAIRAVIDVAHSLDPDLDAEARPMSEVTAFSMIPLRVAGTVILVAGSIGLFLAALGVFGVVGYAVRQRHREIGIRLALGARAATIVRYVAREGLAPTAAGLVLGIAAAAAAVPLLRGLLVGISPIDPGSFAIASLLLLAAAMLAAAAPIRQALRVDPVQALRSE